MNKTITQFRWLVTALMLVAAMVMPFGAWAEENNNVGYAVFNSATGTLTFKYGVKPSAGDNETVYDLNTEENDPGWTTNNSSIKAVVFDETFKYARPTSCYEWFLKCYNLTTITDIQYLNTSEVTSMVYMFYNCSGLTSLDLSSFNTQKVKNMNRMFRFCEFTTLDLSSFNTGSVNNMSGMFQECSNLTTLTLPSNFDTSEVTDMSSMFYGCSGLTSLDLSSFNTSKVTEMYNMFNGCSNLTSLDLSNFDTSEVTKMYCMFNGCSKLNTIYVSDMFTTDNVTTLEDMFNGCTNLKGAISYDSEKANDKTYANYVSGYFKTYYTQNGEKTELYGNDTYDQNNKAYNISSLNFTDGDIVTNVPLNVSGDISYTRTMTNEWGTLCLPFDVTYTNKESYKLYSLTSANESTLTFTEYEDNTAITAGTPMAIKRISDTADNSVTITTTDCLVKTSLTNPESDDAWHLVGTYRTVDVPDEGYVISQNAFWNVKGLKDEGQNIKRVRVNGYRAYIMPPTAASEATVGLARMFSIEVPDDNTTAIDDINDIDDINAVFGGEATYYDTNGRRIPSLRQGVNIVKIGNRTRKVIIK